MKTQNWGNHLVCILEATQHNTCAVSFYQHTDVTHRAEKSRRHYLLLLFHVNLAYYNICYRNKWSGLLLLIWVALQRQQPKQCCSDFPHPRHVLQLFQGYSEAFPGQAALLRALHERLSFSPFLWGSTQPRCGGNSFQPLVSVILSCCPWPCANVPHHRWEKEHQLICNSLVHNTEEAAPLRLLTTPWDTWRQGHSTSTKYILGCWGGSDGPEASLQTSSSSDKHDMPQWKWRIGFIMKENITIWMC